MDDRIEDIVGSGQRTGTRKAHELVADVLAAISLHYAIPVDELEKAVNDALEAGDE